MTALKALGGSGWLKDISDNLVKEITKLGGIAEWQKAS